MPRYTTSQTYTEGNTQVVSLDAKALVPVPEPQAPLLAPEDEDFEVKLRRITEQVPVRISNTSGSSAGSGSGDFHQYRQMRRREQDRLARMDADYQKRKELVEFKNRQESRLKADEERTAKRRAKRLKKKEKKKLKTAAAPAAAGAAAEAAAAAAAAGAAAGAAAAPETSPETSEQ